MEEKKLKCRLCEKYYNDEDMSEEHYPAHSVGNDDIIALDFTKLMDTLMGDNQECQDSLASLARRIRVCFSRLIPVRIRAHPRGAFNSVGACTPTEYSLSYPPTYANA